jgi:uncharacterized delta-60 repeat protein
MLLNFIFMKNIKFIFLIIGILMLSPYFLAAQTSPYLDTTFNAKSVTLKGKNVMPINAGAKSIEVDNLGRPVIAACSAYNSYEVTVYRLKLNGTLDMPFGKTTSDSIAKIRFSDYGGSYGVCNDMLFQSDGKILIAGHVYRGASGNDMYVFRLNSNGMVDSTFGINGFWIKDFLLGTDEVHNIALQSDGKIVVSGRSNNKIRVERINSNGSADPSFIGYLSTNTYNEVSTGLDVRNDTIVSLGHFNNATLGKIMYTVTKLSPNGNFKWRKDLLTNYSTTDNSAHVKILPNRNILIGGYTYDSFKMVKLTSEGNLDSSFAVGGVFLPAGVGPMPIVTSFVLDLDGNIYLTGHTGGKYTVLRVEQSGKFDLTFGVNGVLSVATGASSTCNDAAWSRDGKLYMVADESNSSAIVKVKLRPSVHIFGNAFVSAQSVENYKIVVPASWTGITYSWTYSDLNHTFLPNANGAIVSLLFHDNVSSGRLKCTVSSTGGVIAVEEIFITVNTNANAARQLATLQCTPGLSDCSNSYMDLFQLNKTRNVTKGCSNNGYSDFTPSNYTDTLYIGGVYSAKLKVGGEGVKYVSMWIDYNNDGIFNSSDEYLGESSSSTEVVDVNNIIFKNEVGYEGAKRLRVRCRTEAQFKPD